MRSLGELGTLDTLFDEWLAFYPPPQHSEFHKDGIVDDHSFRKETTRLLYVLLEPNSKGGKYDRFRGCDLRKIFGEVGLGKAVDLNLARWTGALLDGATEYSTPSAEAAKAQLRRVAIMNLKKLAGSGTADLQAVSVQAWRDRKFIRREVEIIDPNLIVTCGWSANRLFGWIISGYPFREVPEDSIWAHRAMKILPANHPSLRPKDAPSAFARLIQRASAGGVSASSGR